MLHSPARRSLPTNLATLSGASVIALLAALLFLLPAGALASTGTSVPLPVGAHPMPVASSVSAVPSSTPASSPPIGETAGSVAATIAPWADYAATGYHKLNAEAQIFGPAVYDPKTGDLWIAQSNPTWYEAPTEVLELNASTLAPAGIVHGLSQASGLAYDAASGSIYVADPLTNEVQAVDATTGAAVGSSVHVGPDPVNLSFNPSFSLLYVVNAGNRSVAAINTTSGAVVAWSANLGSVPGGIAYDPVTHDVAVALVHGLVWLNGKTLYNRTFFGSASPVVSVAIDQQGWAYTGDVAGDMTVLNLTTVEALDVGLHGSNADAAVFDAALDAIFFTDLSTSEVSEVSTLTQTVVRGYDVGSAPTYEVLLPGTDTLEVLSSASLYSAFFTGPYLDVPDPSGRTVSALDGLTGAINGTSPNLAASPSTEVYDPDDGAVVVGDDYTNNLSFIPASDPVTGSSWSLFVNGTPGQSAYDPLTRTLWVPMLVTLGGFCCGQYYPDGVLLVLNASTGAVVTVLYPDAVGGGPAHDNDAAVVQVIYDPGTQSMIVSDFWNDVPWVDLSLFNATTYAAGPELTSAGFYSYANAPNIPQMVLDPVHQQLYVTSPGNNTVMIFDATTLTWEATDNVGVQPTGLAFDAADGDLYVVNTGSYNLTIINGTSRAVAIQGVQLSGVPVYIAYDPDTELLYVGMENGVGPFPINLETSLVVLDGSSLGAVWGPWPTIYVGWASVFPLGSALFVPSDAPGTPGQIWTTNTWDGSVTVISIPPAVSLIASPPTVSEGNAVTFNALVTGGSNGYTFAYTGLPPGCAAGPSASFTCIPTATGTFPVGITITDGLGLTATAWTNVTVVVGLTISSASVTPGAIDLGQTVWANATAAGGTGPYTFLWTWGDGSTSPTADATHVYGAGGTYTVQLNVSDAQGNLRSWSSTVVVSAVPTLTVSYLPANPVAGSPVQLTATVSGGTAPWSAISWNFGDTSTGSGLSVAHTYAAAGTYTVTATTTDARGMVASGSASLEVGAASALALTLVLGANQTAPGAPVTVVAEATGGVGPYSFAWTLNGTTVPGTGSTLTYTPQGAASYSFTATVTDSEGHTASAHTVLQVLPAKVVSVPGKNVYSNTTASAGLGALAPYAGLGVVLGLLLGLILGFVLFRRRSHPDHVSDEEMKGKAEPKEGSESEKPSEDEEKEPAETPAAETPKSSA